MPNSDSPVETMEINSEVKTKESVVDMMESTTENEESVAVAYQLAEEKKNKGNTEYSKKNYDAAIKLYTEAINLNPTAASYYGNRAACYIMLEQYERGIEDARKSIQTDPLFAKGYLREAKCQLALGEVAASIHLYKKVLEMEPNNSTAISELKQANLVEENETKATAFMSKEDYRTAVYHLDRCIEMCSGCIKYKILRAECLAMLHRYQEAQDISSDVLRQDGSCVDAIYVRGVCLYYMDNSDKAFQHFKTVLERAPDHQKAKTIYRKAKSILQKKEEGNNAFKKGKYQEALDIYTEVLNIDPFNKCTNSKVYFNRATVNCKMGKLEQAVEDCTKAIALDGDYLKAYLRRAKCYTDLEKYEEAVREYETILKLDKSKENRHLLQQAKFELKKSKRKDYYKILALKKDASEDDIKKAYRKHALLHHPDRHSHATDEVKKSEEIKFKEIGEAYAILSDPKKKARYDSGQDLEEINGGGGFENANFDPNIIFQSFFGGGQSGFSSGFSSSSGGYPGGFTFQFG